MLAERQMFHTKHPHECREKTMSNVEAAYPVAQTKTPFHPKTGYSRHRWTVAKYHRMMETGLLSKADRVELIEGELIAMAPIGSPHGGEVNYLVRCFAPLMAQDKIVLAVQNPVTLPDDSEPQPDIAVLRWRDDFYRKSHPLPENVLLIIEVADTTTQYDRDIKIPLYARHHIPEVWLIDLQQRRLESYRQPEQGEYCQVNFFSKGSISPEQLAGITIGLAGLFLEQL